MIEHLSPEEQEKYKKADPATKRRLTLIYKRKYKKEYEERGEPLPEWIQPKKRPRTQAGRVKRSKEVVEKEVKEAKRPKSVSDLRGELAGMLKKHNLDPIEELIIHCKNQRTPQKEKVQLYKFLVPYMTPTLKAVDMQQDLKMNVSVQLQSFDGARISDMKLADPVPEEEYEEFLTDENVIEMELDGKPDLEQSEKDVLLG
jgi:hypothetical protein